MATLEISTRRQMRKLGFGHPVIPAPLPPMVCPSCSSTDVELVGGGLWDGGDPKTNERVGGGTSDFGLCRRCRTRVARWNDSPCYIPTDEEWQIWALQGQPDGRR
jgi:hypothetical protein